MNSDNFTGRTVPKFKQVAVLMGGMSREREISLRSGKAVANGLRHRGILVDEIDIRQNPVAELAEQRPAAVFVALHGSGGEDGSIQEILETLKIPYTGSSPCASRQAFYKDVSKRIFEDGKITTPEYRLLKSARDIEKIDFTGPWVVKPVAEGSSIGVAMVHDRNMLAEEIHLHIEQHGSIIVERRILGREVTVGILEEAPLPVIEVKTTRDFYDYKAKYTPGFTEYLVPAPLDAEKTAQIQALAMRVHRALGLSNFSRIDFILDNFGTPFVLEANSIPGFTDSSLLPKAARCAGVEFDELCLRIMNAASLKSETFAFVEKRS